MAKANVLARRIRAYERRVVEIESRHGRNEAVLAELEHLEGKWTEATAALESFLMGRISGPWAKVAAARV